MGKSKRCVYSLCPNSGDSYGKDEVFFITLPRPKKDLQKCKRWIAACGRYDSDLLNRLEKCTLYICSLHFVGEKGPTDNYPDPIPFRETKDTLKLMGYDSFNTSSSHGETSVYASSSHAVRYLSQPTLILMPLATKGCSFSEPIEIKPVGNVSDLHTLNTTSMPSVVSGQTQTVIGAREKIVNYQQLLPVKPSTITCPEQITLQTKSKFSHTKIQRMYAQDAFNFDSLKAAFTSSQIILPKEWSFRTSKNVVVVFKSNLQTSSILISLTVLEESLIPVLKVYGQSLPDNHPMLTQLPKFTSIDAIYTAINIFKQWLLCGGIKDVKHKTQFEARDFNKKDGQVSFFTNHVHSTKCDVILKKLKRMKTICDKCSKFKGRIQQQITQKKKSTTKERRNHYLSCADLQMKIKTIKRKNENLTKKIKRLGRKFLGELKKKGQRKSNINNDYLKNILKKSEDSLPEESITSLFVEQQATAFVGSNKSNFKWHPKINRTT